MLDDWRKLMTTMPDADSRFQIVREMAFDLAGRASADGKADMVDRLVESAQAYDFFGKGREAIEREIAEQIKRAERDLEDRLDRERLYREADDRMARQRGNGATQMSDAFDELRSAWKEQRERRDDPPAPSLPQVHWHGETVASESRPWLVHDLVPEVGVGLISGQWGTFKTFTALDLAHAVMTGELFVGFETIRRGGVLFIAVEGASEIAIRLQGAIERGGKITGRAPFAWIESSPPLVHKNAHETLAGLAKHVAEKLERDFGLPLALIVVDTVVAAAGFTKDGQENDAALGQAIMRTLAHLSRAIGCFVVGIDHFGKAIETGTRGSSAKEGAADVVLALLGDKAVSGEVTGTRLALRKLRGGTAGREFSFKPRVVDMGIDQHGKPITTLVLDWGAKDEPPAKSKDQEEEWGTNKSVKQLRQTIMALLAECGVEIRPWADGPMVRALRLDLVRGEFRKGYYVGSDSRRKDLEAKRKAFKRAIDIATERKVIVTREIGEEEFVWLAGGPDLRA
jgi:hypothetical protein